MKLPKLNIARIKKALKTIEDEPRRLEMRSWGRKLTSEDLQYMGSDAPPCGTRACFGGWVVLNSVPVKKWPTLFAKKDTDQDYVGGMKGNIFGKAQKLVGFTDHEANRVFCGDATDSHNIKIQLSTLKRVLNDVFKERGLKTRV